MVRFRLSAVLAVELWALTVLSIPRHVVEAPRPAEQPGVQTSRDDADERAMGPRVRSRLPEPVRVHVARDEGVTPPPGHSGNLTGRATWYRAAPDVAAAGPALRRALGPDWRGQWVVVRSGDRSVTVQLTDWCACGPRGGVPTVIDLSDDAFAALAPLAVGVITVTVSPVVPPATDTP